MQNLTPDRAREIGRIGGLASAKARRAKRTMREIIMHTLAEDEKTVLDNGECAEMSAGEAIARCLIRQATEGNIKAAEFIRDTIGEKPGKAAAANDAPSTHEIKIRVVE